MDLKLVVLVDVELDMLLDMRGIVQMILVNLLVELRVMMLQMTRTYCWSGWCAYWRYESDENDVGEAGGYKGGRCCGGYI